MNKLKGMEELGFGLCVVWGVFVVVVWSLLPVFSLHFIAIHDLNVHSQPPVECLCHCGFICSDFSLLFIPP